MDAKSIIDAVLAQSGTDASRPTLLSILNERYLDQVAQSQWLLETVTLGTTVAGTTVYPLGTSPEIVEVLGLKVGSYAWDRVGLQDMWDLTTGTATFTGLGGVFAPNYDATGTAQVSLFPTPTTSGIAIQVIAAVLPTALADGTGTVNTPVTPTDTHGALVDGVTSLVLRRVDERPDLAQNYEGVFASSTEEIRRRKNSLVRGRGPIQMQVAGYHWDNT